MNEEGDEVAEVYTFTTNTDGVIDFKNLTNGSYRITETKAPDGYELLSEPIEFTISRDAERKPQVTITKKNEKDQVTLDERTFVFTVIDEAGTALPETGGPGTTLYTMAGMALLLMSGFMYNLRLSRRRCKASGH